MAVDQLVLERHIPGGKNDQQQRGGQQPQRFPEGERGKPAAVNGDNDALGRQLRAPQEAAGKPVDPIALLLV